MLSTDWEMVAWFASQIWEVFQMQLNMLLEQGFYDQHDQTDRYSCNTFSNMVPHPSCTGNQVQHNFESSYWLLTLVIVSMQFLQMFKCNTVAKTCVNMTASIISHWHYYQYEQLTIKSLSGILRCCTTLYVHL